MFAAGDPRVAARTPADADGAAVASGSAAAGGRPSPALEEGTNEAVMAMAAAGGCNVSVLTGAQSDGGGGVVGWMVGRLVGWMVYFWRGSRNPSRCTVGAHLQSE